MTDKLHYSERKPTDVETRVQLLLKDNERLNSENEALRDMLNLVATEVTGNDSIHYYCEDDYESNTKLVIDKIRRIVNNRKDKDSDVYTVGVLGVKVAVVDKYENEVYVRQVGTNKKFWVRESDLVPCESE